MYFHSVFVFLLFYEASGTPINIIWLFDANMEVPFESVQGAVAFLSRDSSLKINLTKIETSKLQEFDEAKNEICQHVELLTESKNVPHLLLDTTRSGFGSRALKSVARGTGIPSVTLSYGGGLLDREWNDITPDESKYLVHILPPSDVISRAIRQFIIEKSINNAAIIHDDSIIIKSQYHSLLLNVPILHSIEKINDLHHQLEQISTMNLKNIFIVGNSDNIKSVLERANHLGMFGNKFKWFIATKDEIKNFSCYCSSASITLLHPQSVKNHSSVQLLKRTTGIKASPDIDVAFYYEATMRAIMAIRSMIDKRVLPDNWSFQGCDKDKNVEPSTAHTFDLLKFMKEAIVSESYGPMIFGGNNHNQMVFKVGLTQFHYNPGVPASEYLAEWSPEKPGSFTLATNASLSVYQGDVPTYRIVTVIQPPFVYKTMDNDGTPKFTGFCIDLIDSLSEMLNFKYEIHEAQDGEYGFMDSNHQWNGLMKELINNNADIGLGAISVMSERERVIDFTIPFYERVGQIIMMQKPHNPTSLFKFMEVLDDVVWICIVIAYFITSCMIYFLDKNSPYSYQNNMELYKDDETEKRIFDFRESLWFCITCVIPQGGGTTPKNLSGKIVAAFWWLFVFIVIASYIANLAAFLTVSRLAIPISSLSDLSKQYQIRYSPLNGSATMHHFERRAYVENVLFDIWDNWTLDMKASPHEFSLISIYEYPVIDIYAKIKRFMEETGLPNTIDEAIHLIRNPPFAEGGGQYAFVGDATDIRYAVITNCDLQTVGEQFSSNPYALAVQSGSPLKRQLNYALTQLFTDRQMDVLKSKWWDKNQNAAECPPVVGDDESGGISIYNIGGLFIIICMGIVCSLIALAWENWYYKRQLVSSGRTGSTYKSPFQNQRLSSKTTPT